MPSRQTALVLILCALTLVASGCRKRTAQAAPPAVSPAPPEKPATPVPAANETKPESPPETGGPGLVIPPAKPAPIKPRATAPESAQPKPAPPQMSPGLSPEEQAAAERRTHQDISAAERNLQAAYGKQLNTTQHDLVEKVRGFLAQAHEAIRASDWLRARNLAQKAQVLSVELVNSL